MTHLLAVLGMVLISFSAILVRLADVAPSTAAFFRTAYALPVLAIGWFLLRRHDDRQRRERWLAFLAGMLLAIDLAFWHRSIAFIGAGLATVLANIQVVFVGVAAWFMHRERPTGWAFGILPYIFLGAALISGLGRPGTYGIDPIAGTVFGALAGLMYAAFLLIFRVSTRRRSPSVGPLLDATAGAAIASFIIGRLDGGLVLGFDAASHGWLLLLALGPHVTGWLLITWVLPRLPALETSVLLLLQPAMTVIWAVLFYGEHLAPAQWSGALVVLAGVGLLSMKGSVQPGDARNALAAPDPPPRLAGAETPDEEVQSR